MIDKYGRLVVVTSDLKFVTYSVQDLTDGARFSVKFPLGTTVQKAFYTIESMAPSYVAQGGN